MVSVIFDMGDIAQLVAELASEDEGRRQRARAALVDRGQSAIGTVTAILQSDEDQLRLQAAAILAEIHDPTTVEPLVRALADRYPPVRCWAAIGLGLIGDRAAVAPLVEALKDPETASLAAEALGLLAEGAAVPALAESLETCLHAAARPDYLLLLRGGVALVKLERADLAVPFLRRVLMQRFPSHSTLISQRAKAITPLVDAGALSLKELNELMTDSSPDVQAQAAAALVKLDAATPTAIALLERVAERTGDSAELAKRALGQWNGKKAIKHPHLQ